MNTSKYLCVFLLTLLACNPTETNNRIVTPNSKESETIVLPAQLLKVPNWLPLISTPHDISFNAERNFKNNQAYFDSTMRYINSFKNYAEAEKHLNPKQLEMMENEMIYAQQDHLQIGGMGCSWYCAAWPDTIISSSTLKPSSKFTYDAQNCHDFSLRTAWIEGDEDEGIGASITYYFDMDTTVRPTHIQVYNGYQKNEKTWIENGRVKSLLLSINNNKTAHLLLSDTISEQVFTINADDIPIIKSLKFEITDVYLGSKYKDIAISELIFDGIGDH